MHGASPKREKYDNLRFMVDNLIELVHTIMKNWTSGGSPVFLRRKIKMKRFYFIVSLLCLVLVLSCGGRQAGSASSAPKSIMDGKVKGNLPLADGKTTLTMFVGGLDNFVTSYEYADNELTKKMVDETGIKLEIIGSSRTDATQKMNVLLSSGDYPEVFILGGINRDFMTYYASTGQFIALEDDMLLQYPRIKTFFERYPQVYPQIRWGDGKVHVLPGVNDCEHCTDDAGRAFIYMPWLRNNNIKQPSTLDEFINYLRFVRDNDLNGNGNRNDEVPYVFRSDGQQRSIALFAKMYMPFIMTGSTFGLALDDNRKVVEHYKDPRFREALKTMASMYKERLILPESFTQNSEQLISLVESKDPTVAVLTQTHLSNVTYGTGDRRLDFNLLPVLAGPTGLRYGSNRESWSIVSMGMAITDKCKDPELAVALYDYMLRMDVLLGIYIGPKGVAWDDARPGTMGINGKPAIWRYLITWRGPDHKVNMGWNQIGNFPQTLEFRLGEEAMDFDIVREWKDTGNPALRQRIMTNASYFETHNYLSLEGRRELWIPDKYFIPPINMDADDTARMADINTPLNNYINQAHAQFITGDRDINNDAVWNAYLAELDRMGANDRVALLQKYVK
jgi:putative aldouronate transport system substrate-binding protein